MKDLNRPVFIDLFKKACEKCFGVPLTAPLSETDSKLLSTKIFEQTGLVIGVKSIKNYSQYVLGQHETKQENPSVATLDTFARYVLGAPYTSELQRKDKEDHHPYWFQYRRDFMAEKPTQESVSAGLKKSIIIFSMIVVFIVGFFLINRIMQRNRTINFIDNFNSVPADSLRSRGWILKSRDTAWWNKRNEKPGYLTLYTLKGDNWSLGKNNANIKNLLLRKISSDCFAVETHLSEFVPEADWQQAGILLSEDSTFTGRMIRFTILYNSFFGGYQLQPEISVQVVASSNSGIQSKPEEIAQLSLFKVNPGDSLVAYNLKTSALKIEKRGNHFRFLYIASPVESFAYKEAASADLDIKPAYVGIFAIQGWAEKENIMPVHFDSFVLTGIACDK